MIFQRKTPKRIPNLLRDDDVEDIARDISAAQGGSQRENRPQEPRSGSTGSGGPAFFGPGSDIRPQEPSFGKLPAMGLEDPTQTWRDRSADARAAEEAAARDAAERAGDPSVPADAEKSREELIAERIDALLAEDLDTGPARSAMDEALRQASAEARLGARARTGIAGMGLTGAAAAAEGTEARRGERERQMTLDQFDRAARAEELQRLLSATGEIRAGSRESREQQAFELAMKLLQEELDNPPTTDSPGSTRGDGVIERVLDSIMPDETTPARSGRGETPGDYAGNPIIVTQPPEGATLVNPSASFGGELYQGKDGKYYGVRKEGVAPQAESTSDATGVPRSSLPADAVFNPSASERAGRDVYYSPSTRRFYEVID